MRFIEENYLAHWMCVWINATGRVEGGWIYGSQRGGSDPGDGYFLEFWRGVGTSGRILAPILMTVGDLGEMISCSLGSRL